MSGRPFGTQFMPNSNNGQISPKIESNSSNNTNTTQSSTSHNQQDSHIKLESNSSSSLLENNKNKHNNSSNLVNNNNSNNNTQQNTNTNNSGLNQLSFGNLYIQNPSHNNLQSNQFYPPPHPPQPPPHQLHHSHHQQQLPPQPQPPPLQPPSNGIPSQQSNNIILYSLNNLPPQQQQQQQQQQTITPQTDFQLGSLNHLNSQSQQQIRRLTQDWHGTYPNPMASNLMNPMQQQPVEPWIQDEYPEIDIHTPIPEYWCTVNYFEGDLQVGDIFKVRSNYLSVVIDGFFDSSREDRFCLGALTNVQRTNASEKARLHIGKGIQLENQMDGSVYVRCLSDYSVFFESYYLDRESGREAFDAVHKIYPGSRVKVFSLRECLRCLKLAATMQLQANQNNSNSNNSANSNPANSSVNVQNINSNSNNNNNNNNVNVDDLRRLCRLRFSFVKGWGPDYPRKSILETPCWCEIQLNRPLQYLDQLINSLSVNNLNTNSGMF